MSRIIDHLRIPLEDIKSATNDFGDDYIGRGGFGKVYKGHLRDSTVAVKRLDQQGLQGNSEFWKEIAVLSEYKHENIISLLGFCDESGEKIIVYEYASRESLDLYIPSAHLGWIQRLKICLGAARGLQYLHYPDGTQQRIIHRDMKSSNILLDEDWRAKISDFGLSRLSPANQPNSGIVTGTLGYCDPLYVKEGILTKESDVFSFGVVLYEVLCGRLCHTSSKGGFWSFVDLARYSFENNKLHEIFYDRVSDDINPESLKAFATIAYRCVNKARKDRPTMIQVVNELKIALGHQLNTYTPLKDASCEDLGELNRDTSFEVALRYDFGKMLFGCKHLRSRCKLCAPCCKRIFPCRRCHDEYTSKLRNPDERHKMVSRDVNRVICTICQTEQPVGHICGNCGAKMGEYFCRVCKLYDDDTSKGQFHCDDCGICRLDGRENFFHCHDCGSCIHVSRRRTHTYTCSKNALRKAWESLLLL